MILGALAAGSREAAAQGEHRWGGLLFDSFAREASGGGVEAWTAEDGGRIRYRNPSNGAWSFQDVPDDVRDTLHRVFFLPGTSTGWAVGKGGWVLKTTNGGSTWSTHGSRIPNQGGGEDPYEELFDIHFLDSSDGWMVGLHSIWSTVDGGATWDNLGNPFDPFVSDWYDLSLDFVELYSLDILEREDDSRLALISGQPGIILRSTDSSLATWEVVWDIQYLCAASPCGGSTSQIPSCACDICPSEEDHEGPWFEAWDVDIGSDEEDPLAVVVGGVGGQCGAIFASYNDGDDWSPELHECRCVGTGCISNCASLAAYNDDPQLPLDLNRHQSFKTIYGVDILEDNSAFGAAYNGQMLVRYSDEPVWKDRSMYAAGVPTVPESVTFPLTGAAGVDLNGGGTRGIITGEGGHLLESDDDGDTWDQVTEGEPHRIADVFFKDVDVGWHVGQFFRIARTNNGGVIWSEQDPPSSPVAGSFQSVRFAATSEMHGVAVGDAVPGSSTCSVPKIRYTDATLQASSEWADVPGSDEGFQAYGSELLNEYLHEKGLNRVTWLGGEEFWAVGDGGLILKSLNGGAFWRLVLPESTTTLYDFEMEGVAFVPGTTTGIIVGRRPVSSVIQGVAYQYKNVGGTVTWTSLSMPSGLDVDGLWDVAIQVNGSTTTAWMVGEQTVGGDKEGVVISSVLSSGNFGSLTNATPSGGIPACLTGDDRAGVAVLLEVEIAPNTGAVWTGGACGRLWSRSAGGTWTQVKSATDAHMLGLSFVADGSGARGFIGGFRATQTQQCITSVQ